jgi:hypothetical protein
MAVYMLRYNEPAGNPDKPRASAQHYIGYARDDRLHARIAEHRDGTCGAKLPMWFHAQGIGFHVVRIWPNKGRTFERKLKKAGHYERYNPLPF